MAMPVPAVVTVHPAPLAVARLAARGDEVDDVEALLMDHARASGSDLAAARPVAHAVAVACLGDHHLWQDLQLGSRAELSALMRRWFPTLVLKNAFDMKWKKFLYRQLCEREGLVACRSPSCAVCSDHPACFGAE